MNNRLFGELMTTVTSLDLSNDAMKELVAQAKLMGGSDGPAWVAVSKRQRKSGLPGKPVQSSATKEVIQTTMVTVDRSAKPNYPEWVKKVEHPEFECKGPVKFALDALEQVLIGNQKTGGYETGRTIYKHLQDNDMLRNYLNLQDLRAIQKFGIRTFRKHFNGKAIFAWKSVVRSRNGSLYVPFLIENDGWARLYWRWLNYQWLEHSPAHRFAG